jgi:hypothetical protein
MTAHRVFTEFRGIQYVFFTSVYSACCTELANIPRTYTEFRIVLRNSVKCLSM